MKKHILLISLGVNIALILVFAILFSYYWNIKINGISTTLEEWFWKYNNISSQISRQQEYFTQMLSRVSQGTVSVFSNTTFQFSLNSDASSDVFQKDGKISWWAGILLSKPGYVLTNKHVVNNKSNSYSVRLQDWREYQVKNIWYHPNLDLALLKITDKNNTIPNDLVGLTFAATWWIEPGQLIFTIWNVLGEFDTTISMWIISATNRNLQVTNTSLYTWLYQIDVTTNPGNSWWPLINKDGLIIGIVTAITNWWNGIAFALPVSQWLVDEFVDLHTE
jgi:S1-C subfamily serine protease